MPAPPPESEPAIVSATGVRVSAVTAERLSGVRGREGGALVAAGGVRADVAAQLQPDQGRGQLSGFELRTARQGVRARGAALDQREQRTETRFERRALTRE